MTVAITAALAAPASVQGQSVAGRVLDGRSRSPVADARVTLVHPDGRDLSEPVATDDEGAFLLEVPGPGAYYVRAEAASYRPLVDGVVEFTSPDGRIEVELFLRSEAIELEGLDVSVERGLRRLRAEGFYDRAATGLGDLIPPEEVEKRGVVSNTSDYLRAIPEVRNYKGLILFRAALGGLIDVTEIPWVTTHMCEANVWVDGILMPRVTPEDDRLEEGDFDQGLDSYLNPQDILAIEVYRRASSTPLRWGGMGGSCGTIVIWTKGGR